jgi:hypothetical protein
VRPLGEFQLQYLHVVVREVQTELDRRLELRTLAQMRKDQAQRRRDKRQEMRDQMEELGLDMAILTETIERMVQEDEAAVEAAKTPLTKVWEAHFKASKGQLRRMAKAETDDHLAELDAKGEAGEGEGAEGEGGEFVGNR